jgi:hypothetical protein
MASDRATNLPGSVGGLAAFAPIRHAANPKLILIKVQVC